MPGLSKYVFTYEGDAYSLETGRKLHTSLGRRNKLPTNRYQIINDKGVKEYVEKSEIIQYGKHHKTLPETPRQYIDRTLFQIQPNRGKRFRKYMKLGNQAKCKK